MLIPNLHVHYVGWLKWQMEPVTVVMPYTYMTVPWALAWSVYLVAACMHRAVWRAGYMLDPRSHDMAFSDTGPY